MQLVVNGVSIEVAAKGGDTLAFVLRSLLGDTSVKTACSTGECGSCAVMVEGIAVLSCVSLMALVEGAAVETAVGLAGPTTDLREALADNGGFQCGFCTPGQVVVGHWVASSCDGRSREEVAAAMSGVLCRCTGSVPIVDAVAATARMRHGAAS